MKRTVTLLLVAAFSIPSIRAQSPVKPITPAWTQVAPGVWKTTVGQAESITLLKAAGGQPAHSALKALPEIPFPLDPKEIEARTYDWKTSLRFPLGENEDIYGLGVDFASLRRNGTVFELHVDHWNRRAPTPGRTHAPVPLYVSTKGFAVLFDTPRYLKVNVGVGIRRAATVKPTPVDRTTRTIRPTKAGEEPVKATWVSRPPSDSVEVLANTLGMDVYVFAGPTPLDAVSRYNLFCGGGALPPKWGLGFMNRLKTAYSAADALADVATFREHGIPLDILGLEPGWMDHAYPCSYVWDPTRFPDPKGFLNELTRQGVRANLWINPYVGPPHTPLQPKLAPYSGSHLVWHGVVPDYTLQEPRKIFQEHFRQHVLAPDPVAVAGFKIDEVDGYDASLWPDMAIFPSGQHAEVLRQTYGLLVQHMIHDLYRERDQRTMGQIRGTNAGASPYPFVIYNDNYDFGEYITAVVNSGFVGVLWSPEVRGSNDPMDMLRRVQAVCFSPLALYNGWASEQKLWTHQEVADHIRDAIKLRLRLIPYFYSSFAQYHFQGTPVIRPMPLAVDMVKVEAKPSPATGALDATHNPYEVPAAVREVKDQYFFGDSLLVAPIAPADKTRKVVLPAGKWYDFYTGKLAGENTTIEVTPPLSQIPVFVKEGALIPMLAEDRPHAPAKGEILPLEIRHYGTAPSQAKIYDDDGETFAFERGEYSWTTLRVTRGADGKLRGEIIPDANGRTWSYSKIDWKFMTQP